MGRSGQAVFCVTLLLVAASQVHIRCCSDPVEVSLLLSRFVWWLDLIEGPSAFWVVGRLLDVFLSVAECLGFRADGQLP